ncbi:MAG: UDP-N-acetylmuramoyl-L-alanine--D-glutamate ligase, partial [bacterium]|nr:UDP-N-acetylmuramoyl-L-alanine--D-glutamate ligase [bacterium]
MNLVKKIQEIKVLGQKILVVGLGISGYETAKKLSAQGLDLICIDKAKEEEFARRNQIDKITDLRSLKISVNLGIDGEDVASLLKGVALCVLSPGISLESSIVAAIERAKIPICNELELGIDLLSVPTVVVTGSNGKSTTVSLIHEMLQHSAIDSKLCGNVGIPVISLVGISNESSNNKNSPLVVEASSYQIETCYHLKPKVGVWLNISENHLERHGTIERYLRTKAKIFERQTKSDFAIINIDDPRHTQILNLIDSEILGFGQDQEKLKNFSKNFALIEYSPINSKDLVLIYLNNKKETYDCSELKIDGIHNRYNLAAALLAARILGATEQGSRDAISEFTGLRHRFQRLGTFEGISLINDS